MAGRDNQGIGDGQVHTAVFKMDNQHGSTVQHKEICSKLRGSLDRKEVWRRVKTHLCITELLWCSPKTITTLLIGYVVQLLSHARLFVTPWTAECKVSLSFTISQRLLEFTSIESVILSNHLILCHPLLTLPSIFPSIRVFFNESALCILAKVLEFQLQHQS